MSQPATEVRPSIDAGLLPAARLGIVLVNWNRWTDTIECLESILRSTIPVRVVVVDNASEDGSLDYIEAWARGEQLAVASDAAMERFSTPPVAKPLHYERLGSASSGGSAALRLIEAGGNLGFAGGNNVGIRHLLLDSHIRFVWLLNNDTVAEPTAAAALLSRLTATHRVGMCGTVVRYYHRPDIVQALNGSRFSAATGNSRGIGAGSRAGRPFDPAAVARNTDLVLGASLAVSRSFVEAVGPMEEDYFLYFEEIDWAVRNRGRFRTAFAHAATVYHKEGGSIGSSGQAGQRSNLSEYYLMRSRLKFIRRHHPWLLPQHLILGVAQVGRRLLRRQPGKAWAMTRALLGIAY